MSFLIVLCFAGLLPLSCFLATRFFKNSDLRPFVAFGSGILLAICFLEFLPHSFQEGQGLHAVLPPVLILCGVLTQGLADIYLLPRLSFLDRLLGIAECQGAGGHSHTLSAGMVCSAFGCLCLCSFFDGIRLFTALEIGIGTGFATSLGLFFHLLSEGLALVGVAKAGGIKTKTLLVLALSLSMALIAGAFPARLLLQAWPLHFLTAFASGILIYVCFVHLLPLALKQKGRLWFFLGLVLFCFPYFFMSGFHVSH